MPNSCSNLWSWYWSVSVDSGIMFILELDGVLNYLSVSLVFWLFILPFESSF